MSTPRLRPRVTARVAGLGLAIVVASCGRPPAEVGRAPVGRNRQDRPSSHAHAPGAPLDERAPIAAPDASTTPPPTRRQAKPCPAEAPVGMACVSGGWFARGSDRAQPDERPRAEVFVESFLLDVHEVTNARYAPCVASKRCKRPRPFEGYLEPRQPVVAVSWFDAVASCESETKRLPTEAEFERAASGPHGATYAWGDEPLACEASIVETAQGKGCGRGTTWPVGSRPVGHFGLFDVSGNVWEWVADWYSPCYEGCEGACGRDCQGENPRGPCAGNADCPGHGLRGVRGGSWWYPLERARASARRGSEPQNLGPHRFGFRCARDL